MPGRREHEADKRQNDKNDNARFHASMAKHRERHPDAACVKEYDAAKGSRDDTKALLAKWRAVQENWHEVSVVLSNAREIAHAKIGQGQHLTKKEIFTKWGKKRGKAYIRKVEALHKETPERKYISKEEITGMKLYIDLKTVRTLTDQKVKRRDTREAPPSVRAIKDREPDDIQAITEPSAKRPKHQDSRPRATKDREPEKDKEREKAKDSKPTAIKDKEAEKDKETQGDTDEGSDEGSESSSSSSLDSLMRESINNRNRTTKTSTQQ